MVRSVPFPDRRSQSIRNTKSVRQTFLRSPAKYRDSPIPFNSHNYDDIVRSVNLQVSIDRRYINDITFVYKILRSSTTCDPRSYTQSPKMFTFERTRDYLLLNTEQLCIAYDYHSYFNGIMNLTNFVRRLIHLDDPWNL